MDRKTTVRILSICMILMIGMSGYWVLGSVSTESERAERNDAEIRQVPGNEGAGKDEIVLEKAGDAPSPLPRSGNRADDWSASEVWHKGILNNTVHDVATGDLNGDGYADIAAVGENHTLVTYHNDQQYGFDKHFVDINNSKNYTALALGDVDGDGDLDISVLTWPAPYQDPTELDLYLYKNNGQGNFPGGGGDHLADIGGANASYGFLFNLNLASSDFTNDNKADMVISISYQPANHTGNPAELKIFFLENKGGNPITFDVTTEVVQAADLEWGVLYSGITIKEATGDNFNDVLVNIYGWKSYLSTFYSDPRIEVYSGGAGGITTPAGWSYSFIAPAHEKEWPLTADIGEFTGDGNPDIVFSIFADQDQDMIYDDTEIWLAQGNGQGGFANPVKKIQIVNKGIAAWDLTAANFDELNFDDIVFYLAADTNNDEQIDHWEIRIYTTNNPGAFPQNPKWSDNNGGGGNLQDKIYGVWADDFDATGAGDVLYIGEKFNLIDVVTGFEPEFIPPAAIDDLAVSQPVGMDKDTVRLEWSAPGDDGDSDGPAAYYLIHYSNSSMSEANFNQTTNFTSPPQPADPGTSQSVDISQLDSEKTYYFAIRAVDDWGNWGPISNIPSHTLPDYLAPRAIDDLTANYIEGEGDVELNWTAPGDDGGDGTADSYKVYFSGGSFSDPSSATEITAGIPSPAAADSSETVRIDINNTTGLNFDGNYYFGVLALDDNGNKGDLSNVVSVDLPDVAPPDAVILEAAPGEDDGEINLSWKASGDDGSEGKAGSYDIRYSVSEIENEEDFRTATPVEAPPSPADPGTDEEMTVSDLTGGTLYYFGLKVFDESLNPSPLSNIPSATATDKTAPAKVSRVKLEDTPEDNGHSLTLTWESSSAADFKYYRIYGSTSKISEPKDEQLLAEIDNSTVTLYNITEIDGEELAVGGEYYVGILVVDTSENVGEIAVPTSAVSTEDDLPPEIQYHYPENDTVEVKAGETQRFNITPEFYDDETSEVQWYVNGEPVSGETYNMFSYDTTDTDSDTTVTIKVEIDDGTAREDMEWTVNIVSVSADDDTGEDDTEDDTADDTDDDTGEDDTDPEDFWKDPIDSDKDGMDDRWEMKYFGSLDQRRYDDQDGDGVLNLREYQRRTDPTDPKDPGVSGETTSESESFIQQWWWLFAVIGGLILIILVITFVLIVVSRRSKKEKAEDVTPQHIDIEEEKKKEAEDLYGRVEAPKEEATVTDSDLAPETGVTEEMGEAPGQEEMESFFSSVEQPAALPAAGLAESGEEYHTHEVPAQGEGVSEFTLPGARETLDRSEYPALDAGGETIGASETEEVAGQVPEHDDPGQVPDEGKDLDSLFSPILGQEETEEEKEETGGTKGADKFEDEFLDKLLSLSPLDEEEKEEEDLTGDIESGVTGELSGEADEENREEAIMEVDCYNCGTTIPIYTDERPLIITCPSCGVQGEIE